MKPLFSIIVPIYNSEKYLDRCINSILRQTYHNIELILVNDGSTDNSLKICEYYKYYDSRVKVVNKKNGGVSSARNCGMDFAGGDFIGFVDSDDYVDTNMYNRLYECIKDNTDLVVLITHTINNSELFLKDIDSISGYEALNYIFKLEFPTSVWAYLYKRKIIDNIRLNEEVHFFEDFEFNTRALINASSVSLCKELLYNYEINDTSINNQKINDKKISCLGIYDRVLIEKYIDKDLILKKSAVYFRTYFLISIILSLSNSLDVAERKHFILVKKSALIILKDSIKSKLVPTKYKIAILFTAFSPAIATKLIHLFSNIIKRKHSMKR